MRTEHKAEVEQRDRDRRRFRSAMKHKHKQISKRRRASRNARKVHRAGSR